MPFLKQEELRNYLESLVEKFNRTEFIEDDPISVPHRFSNRADIEIAGFFSAVLAWGQRKTILNKMKELLDRMDASPADFVQNHSYSELQRLEGFVHRTFNDTDLLYFIHFLKVVYRDCGSLEKAFFPKPDKRPDAVFQALVSFRKRFEESPFFPARTGKHISTPSKSSACKRLNMFLRWMVRKDDAGVDFGLWDSISPGQLICPCDVHVERQARLLGLVCRPKADWTMATELTGNLRRLSPEDPVRYDFALFGLGISGGIKRN